MNSKTISLALSNMNLQKRLSQCQGGNYWMEITEWNIELTNIFRNLFGRGPFFLIVIQ